MCATRLFTIGTWSTICASKGARFVEELDEVPHGAVAIFSAHGVAQTVEARRAGARSRRARRDLPAGHQGARAGPPVRRAGRTLILIGHAGHPEVEGTIGQIPGKVLLVQSEAEVAHLDLPLDTPLAYVTQTTLSVDDTRGIIDALLRRFTDIVGPDTRDICYATQNRQAAVRELSKQVDVLLVVGATNSSNSNRLREIGSRKRRGELSRRRRFGSEAGVVCERADRRHHGRRFGAGRDGQDT